MNHKIVTFSAIALLGFSIPAFAQLGGLTNPLGGKSSGSGSSVNPDEIKKTIASVLSELTYATSKYQLALGHDKVAAELKETADKLASGSLGVDSSAINQVKSSSESLIADVKAANDAKTKVSAEGKKAAGEGLVYHVKATLGGVKAGKLLKDALSSSSPAALGALGGLKDFPSLLSSWAGATSTVFEYLKANGIDTKDAKAKIDAGMKDS